jgi:adenine-specific DNA-methyltransferase
VPELNFKGKEFVYNHHLTVPFRPLEIQADKGIGEPSLDGNLIIHGDNLHALKALLPMYAGKVDCIFIDPPYNTGNEGWAYNDNVNSPMIREWLDSNPIGIEDGLRHDKWACMMWPRLKLLHELLTEDGSFWMTLDDNESHQAKMMLDEIFGRENLVANLIWQKRYSPQNAVKWFSESHDHLIVYAKTKSKWFPNLLERSDEMNQRYRNLDDDPRGVWKPADSTAQAGHGTASQFYEITAPNGKVHKLPNGRCWVYTEPVFKKMLEDNRIWFGESGNNVPAIKRFLSEVKDGMAAQTIWSYKEAGHNQDAKKEIKEIFPEELPFDTPKPTALLDRIMHLATDANSLVLDSFAGSGTTAHAVLAANARDGGNRRFILVEGEDYADKLTAERVRRVINGYAFTGTQREELLREPITFTKLKNANAMLEKVQQIETLDGPKFDRIKSTVKDGALVVTGERDCTETAPGLGGTFTYCTLGDAIDMDGLLTGADLPALQPLAALLYHTATAQAFDTGQLVPAPDIGAHVYRLGAANGRHLWLFYKPDLDWLKSAEAALTLSNARAIAATAEGEHLVFAPAKFVSRDLLNAQRIPVEYAPLPYALYRVETA